MKTFFTIADESQRLDMPYGKNPASESQNIGYIDLKVEPERIGEILELERVKNFG